jgi:drug/metabolite transporter (DMT)-like permease
VVGVSTWGVALAGVETTPRQSALGLGASALAAVGWGFAGVFADLTTAPALVLTFYRMWIGAGLLSAIVLATGRKLTWRLLRASSLGGLLLCADMAMFFSAIKLTSVAIATVIGALQPALIVIAARPLLGERVGRWDLVWTVVAIVAVATIVSGGGSPSSHQARGDLLAVGSLLAWSAYFLVSKRSRLHLDALDYTAGVTITAAMAMTVVVLVSRQPLSRVRAGDWLWIALIAVIPGSGHLLMNWAHHYLDASVSSVIGSASPIFAAGGAYVIVGQVLTTTQMIGGLVGIAAIAVVAARRQSQ